MNIGLERGIEDAPKFEEFSYDNTAIADRTITAGTTIDFDSRLKRGYCARNCECQW